MYLQKHTFPVNSSSMTSIVKLKKSIHIYNVYESMMFQGAVTSDPLPLNACILMINLGILSYLI